MHLGNILISSKNKNFTHILINNSVQVIQLEVKQQIQMILIFLKLQ